MADSRPGFPISTAKRKAVDIVTKVVIANELSQGAKNWLGEKVWSVKSKISTISRDREDFELKHQRQPDDEKAPLESDVHGG